MSYLHEFETQSAVWLKVKDDIEAEIDRLRKRNDHPLDATGTAALRGQIFALKSLLMRALPDENPILVDTDDFT